MVLLFLYTMSSDNRILKAIREKGSSLESEMSFFDHLEVLRWHLIRSALAIMILFVVAFCNFDFIWNTVIMGPKHGSFLTYRFLCYLGDLLHNDGMCITSIPGNIINTEMAGQFMLQMNSSFMMGLVIGFPYLLFELWRFIAPALSDIERKSARGFVFYTSFLFFLGVLFGYFVVTPLSVHFLTTYQVSPDIQNNFTIDSYVNLVCLLILANGLVFQLPVVVYILANVGVLTPKFMREKRRYAIIIIMVIAMLVTPSPDPITMLVVSIPLILLYEVSITVAGRVEQRKRKKQMDLYKGR